MHCSRIMPSILLAADHSKRMCRLITTTTTATLKLRILIFEKRLKKTEASPSSRAAKALFSSSTSLVCRFASFSVCRWCYGCQIFCSLWVASQRLVLCGSVGTAGPLGCWFVGVVFGIVGGWW